MKKPIYKRWWFILLVIFVFLAYLGSSTSSSSGVKEGFEEGYKDATASSSKATSESVSSSATVSDSPAVDENKAMKSFLKRNKEVNETFAKNLYYSSMYLYILEYIYIIYKNKRLTFP